jgi:hypothetical protein
VTINKNDGRYYYDEKFNIDEGDQIQLTATVNGGSGNGVAWSIYSGTAASVSSTGLLKGVSTGGCYVKAAAVDDPSKYEICYISVYALAQEIVITGGDRQLKPGESGQFKYYVRPLSANQKIRFAPYNGYSTRADTWPMTVKNSGNNDGVKIVTYTVPADEQYHAGNIDGQTGSRYSTYIETWNSKKRGELNIAIIQYDSGDVKPMDYVVVAKDALNVLRSIDGGLRIIADKFGRSLIENKKPGSLKSNEEVVAVIHKINTGTYNYGGSYTVVNMGFTNAPNVHGVAVAVNDNGREVKWSDDKDDVPGSSNWLSGSIYPSCLVSGLNDSRQLGVPLSASAFYYNTERGSSHRIKPEEEVVTYQKSHPVYSYRHPNMTSNTTAPSVPGWFVPTMAEWKDLKSSGAADLNAGIIANIKNAGGTFYTSREYWMIECKDKNNAWYSTYLNGSYSKSKTDKAYVRPFIRF